jgi:hypothetical protein
MQHLEHGESLKSGIFIIILSRGIVLW